jgi:hypothetical protein
VQKNTVQKNRVRLNSIQLNSLRLMRLLIFITISLGAIYGSALADRDYAVYPRTVSLSFSTNENVTFQIANKRVLAVTVDIGGSRYSVPETVCTRLRDVRFDTVVLGWGSSSQSVRESKQFYLQFNIGPPKPGAFPDSPPVRLYFRDAKFAEVTGINVQ